MSISKISLIGSIAFLMLIGACGTDEGPDIEEPKSVLPDYFGDKIDYANLANYANQEIPSYIRKDNTRGNDITDEGATLGRVLFYDKKLSINNTIACASCHKQELAFGDDELVSEGVNGVSGRHSMRLVNSRFADELKFFWDERATSLEDQTTQPIQDHVEMGYSGNDGDPGIADLIEKLGAIAYYPELFTKTFGDSVITEARMQNALAQFVRSIQSFDSKYDQGRAMAASDAASFSNFTTEENLGKQLFLTPPQLDANGQRTGGGLACQGCHRAPEFDIDPNSQNNGIIEVVNSAELDFDVTRAPSLRDVVKADGTANGPFMHNGFSLDFDDVLTHYNATERGNNTNLDRRLAAPGTNGRYLNMTDEERAAVIAFIRTLAGNNIYSDEKWSDPFTE
jgi:cytochrome c peroxidase